MSIKVMTAVWNESMHRGSTLIVLLALADHASDDGVAWPGIERLAELARLEVRQVQVILDHLAATGELYVLHNAGRSYTNLYLVTIGHTAKTLAKLLENRFKMEAAEARQMSYVILERQATKKVHSSAPFRRKKVHSSAEKVHASAEKVHSNAEKGAPQCTLTVINRQLTPTEPEEETVADESALQAAETWDRARNMIRLELPRSTFDERLRDTIGIHVGEDTFEVQCLSQDQADFLKRRLHAKVADALAAVIGRPVAVEFTIRQAPRLLQ